MLESSVPEGPFVNNVYRRSLALASPHRFPGVQLNSESWVLGSGIQLRESGIPLTIGVQNPISTDKDWNPVPGIWNPRYGIQNPSLSWIRLHVAYKTNTTAKRQYTDS